ncbi:hypothetical protein GGF38_001449, partial [Coemansia sp. RSA 25]
GLDNSVPLYKSMGKMFIQESKDDLLKDIAESAKDAQTIIDALEKKQKFVKRDLDDATGNLRDIIQSAQSKAKKHANPGEVIASFVVGINPGIEALEDLSTKVLNVFYGHDPTISRFVLVKRNGHLTSSRYERDHEGNWVIYVILERFKPHQQPRHLADPTKLTREQHIRNLDANRAQYRDTEVGNRDIPCYNTQQREQQARARRQVHDSFYLNQNTMRRANSYGGRPTQR